MALDLSLHTQDLLQVSAIGARDTIALLPAAKRKKQKVVVGDDSGSVTCFETKKGAPVVTFKTLPGEEISALALGGPIGKKDKIFVSTGQQIRGISRKGKEFFKVNTNLAEAIRAMFVEESKLWTAGEVVYTLFDNGKDVGFYMAPDVIHSMCVQAITRETEQDVVFGCRDNHVRVYITGPTASMELTVDGSVMSIIPYGPPMSAGEFMARGGSRDLIYGTQNGRVGQMTADASAIRRGWECIRESKEREACVNCFVTEDLTKDDTQDIIVGRDDGTMQVYGFDGSAGKAIFTKNIGESIRGMASGVVSTNDYLEVVTATYSGKVTSFTTEPMDTRDEDDAYGRDKETVNREAQIARLTQEVTALKRRVDSEKERFSKMVDEEAEFIPMEAQFKVNTSFLLDPEEATYKFTVEIPLPIDVVVLQSAIPIDLMDVESNVAIVSRTPPDRDAGNMLLATYRCQESMNRLEMSARTVEGQYGELQCLVIAKMSPGKTAQAARFPIKPLSLHHRIHDPLDERPMNSIKFSGPFTRSQIHEWILFLLPGVPAKVTSSDLDLVTLTFRNVYLGSQLLVRYKKNEATFLSDSMSTIAIVKEVLTKQATARKIQLQLAFDMKQETIPNFLKLIDPKLTYTLGLSRKVEIIEALKDIKLQTDISFLSAEYQEVIKDGPKFEREFKNQARALEMLYGLITDLYVDANKFKGHSAQHRIPDLMRLLQGYHYDEVLAFFMAPVHG